MSRECKTLFVRNLPFSVTKEKLEDQFSEYGPVKQCFIVNDRVTGKSRGLGYVTFTLREDAVKTKESNISLNGRKLFLDFADITKKKKRERKKKGDEEDKEEGKEMELESEKDEEEEDTKDTPVEAAATKTGQTLKYHQSKIVLVTGLPDDITQEGLDNCLQKLNVKRSAEFKLVGNKSAHIKFKSIRDVKRALRKLHNKTYKDCMLQANQLSKDTGSIPQSTLKRSRVIVRNLSFKCKDEDLQKAFKPCGSISEVKIPTNADGKMLGFGFVQFTSLQDAKKAVDQMNTQRILGRPVAVDWALPKDRYESKQTKTEDDKSDEGSFSAEDEDSSDEDMKTKTVSSEDEGYKDKSSSDDEEEEDDDGSDDQSDVNDDESDDEDEEDDSEEDASSKNKPKKKGPVRSDVDQGCTLFIRNLSFDCDEDGLVECFGQFGDLHYAKVVIDHNTEHSKGMGFVKFRSKDAADKCMLQAENGGLVQDGRQLNVTVAVSRDQASKFQEKKEKEKKDNRNLYLAREGMIRAGTEAAQGMSKADLDKRMKVDEVKRQKLKNINVFISPLRLCVRNIPATVDDKELMKVFKDAAGHKMAKVQECRIMRDLARVNSEGKGKSQGFGFVSFSDHQHALTALRHTNNNPDIFGENKRLIVEFSLENRKALEAKEKRKERFLAKRDMMKNRTDETGNTKKPRPKTGKSTNIPMLQLSEKDKKLKGDKAMPKGLPSHWGPKVRHKKRETQNKPANKKKPNNSAVNRPPPQEGMGSKPMEGKRPMDGHMDGPAMKKRKKRTDVDSFDKLVNNYKNKFMKQKSNKKWFD